MYPILGSISRQAVVDEAIPLSEPIVTADGESILNIPVQKGQLIECAIHGYNRYASFGCRDFYQAWNRPSFQKPCRLGSRCGCLAT